MASRGDGGSGSLRFRCQAITTKATISMIV
jgi:hypothetical protein